MFSRKPSKYKGWVGAKPSREHLINLLYTKTQIPRASSVYLSRQGCLFNRRWSYNKRVHLQWRMLRQYSDWKDISLSYSCSLFLSFSLSLHTHTQYFIGGLSTTISWMSTYLLSKMIMNYACSINSPKCPRMKPTVRLEGHCPEHFKGDFLKWWFLTFFVSRTSLKICWFS